MLEVMVFSTPSCAHCIVAKKMLEKIGRQIPIDLKEIDLTKQPELGCKYAVFSVPAIIINGKLEFAGLPEEPALRKRLEEAGKKSR